LYPGPAKPLVFSFGKLLLEEFGFDKGTGRKAFDQALPYAVRQVLDNIVFCQTLLFPSGQNNYRIPVNQRLVPFLGITAIKKMCKLLFGFADQQEFEPSENFSNIIYLPLVDIHLKQCQCHI